MRCVGIQFYSITFKHSRHSVGVLLEFEGAFDIPVSKTLVASLVLVFHTLTFPQESSVKP